VTNVVASEGYENCFRAIRTNLDV